MFEMCYGSLQANKHREATKVDATYPRAFPEAKEANLYARGRRWMAAVGDDG
jgi:hypothetical protein